MRELLRIDRHQRCPCLECARVHQRPQGRPDLRRTTPRYHSGRGDRPFRLRARRAAVGRCRGWLARPTLRAARRHRLPGARRGRVAVHARLRGRPGAAAAACGRGRRAPALRGRHRGRPVAPAPRARSARLGRPAAGVHHHAAHGGRRPGPGARACRGCRHRPGHGPVLVGRHRQHHAKPSTHDRPSDRDRHARMERDPGCHEHHPRRGRARHAGGRAGRVHLVAAGSRRVRGRGHRHRARPAAAAPPAARAARPVPADLGGVGPGPGRPRDHRLRRAARAGRVHRWPGYHRGSGVARGTAPAAALPRPLRGPLLRRHRGPHRPTRAGRGPWLVGALPGPHRRGPRSYPPISSPAVRPSARDHSSWQSALAR